MTHYTELDSVYSIAPNLDECCPNITNLEEHEAMTDKMENHLAERHGLIVCALRCGNTSDPEAGVTWENGDCDIEKAEKEKEIFDSLFIQMKWRRKAEYDLKKLMGKLDPAGMKVTL
jgi:hypothetical protein